MFNLRCVTIPAAVTANSSFPSSKKSHFQSETKCEAIVMEMIFNYDAKKTHFHNKGFALTVVLKVRVFGTRKWPIPQVLVVQTLDSAIHRINHYPEDSVIET